MACRRAEGPDFEAGWDRRPRNAPAEGGPREASVGCRTHLPRTAGATNLVAAGPEAALHRFGCRQRSATSSAGELPIAGGRRANGRGPRSALRREPKLHTVPATRRSTATVHVGIGGITRWPSRGLRRAMLFKRCVAPHTTFRRSCCFALLGGRGLLGRRLCHRLG